MEITGDRSNGCPLKIFCKRLQLWRRKRVEKAAIKSLQNQTHVGKQIHFWSEKNEFETQKYCSF